MIKCSVFFFYDILQVWQCGGSVEVLPCSRIAHIERAHKPYTENLAAHVRRNALRVAEVWMDQYKSHVYMAWNIPLQVERKAFLIYLKIVKDAVIYLFFLYSIQKALNSFMNTADRQRLQNQSQVASIVGCVGEKNNFFWCLGAVCRI